MKKILAIILCAVMLAVSLMPVGVFAATSIDQDGATDASRKGEGAYSIGVSGKFNGSDKAADVVSVNIAWDKMEFTYNAGTLRYDPETHDTTEVADGSWNPDEKEITVTNNSNVAVNASFAFAGSNGITGQFIDNEGKTVESVEIESAFQEKYQAKNGAALTSPSATVKFSITGGKMSESTNGTLGTITVTIYKK